MFSTILLVFNFFDTRAKKKVVLLGIAKVFLGVFDILGIVLVGALLGKLTSGEFNSPIKFLNLDNFSVLQLGLFAAFAFIFKALGNAIFSSFLISTLAKANASLATKIFAYSLNDISIVTKKYSKSELNFLLTVAPGAAIEILLGTVTIISESFLLFSVLLTFFIVDVEMTLYVLVYFVVVVYGLNYFMGRKLKELSRIETQNSISVTSTIYDTIGAFREIKSLRREDFFLKKFQAAKMDLSNSSGKISFINSLPKSIVESALIIGALGLVVIATRGESLSNSAQSIGIFLAGGLKLMSSLLPLQATFAIYNQLFIKIQMMLDFFKYRSLDSNHINFGENPNNVRSANQPVGVNISGLSFGYGKESPKALENINLNISPGEIVAFVGPSGAGKSTLADLIIGINVPTTGEITFSDPAGGELTREKFGIGYVAQDPGIISGSIRENIALGIEAEKVDKDSLISALDGAHLSKLIADLGDGVNSDLGKQSDSLSGGQLQRIGLARALYIKPNLLVLDEATSALDAESEGIVTEFISSLKGACTVIVIAHRLTTVQSVDNVYVFNEGKLEAQGKFSELAKTNPTFSKFVELSEIKTK